MEMDFEKIEKLMQLMRNYGFSEVELKEGEAELKLVQNQAPAAPLTYMPHGGLMPQVMNPFAASVPAVGAAESKPASGESKGKYHEVKSPFVGTFYAGPAPGAEDFAKIGASVRKGDTLCIVEAMKMMNEIEAEKDGVIVKILASNEQPVEFDQVLFHIE